MYSYGLWRVGYKWYTKYAIIWKGLVLDTKQKVGGYVNQKK